jgi:hypothetical protein
MAKTIPDLRDPYDEGDIPEDIPEVNIDDDIEDADWPKRINDVFFDKSHPKAAKPDKKSGGKK